MRKLLITVWIVIWSMILTAGINSLLFNFEMLELYLKYRGLFYFFALLIMLVPILIIFLATQKKDRTVDTSTEEIPHEFESIYEKLYNNHIQNLEGMRKSVRWRTIIQYIFLGIFLIGYFFCKLDGVLISKKVDTFMENMTIPAGFIGIAFTYMNNKYKKTYAKTYKNEIISNFIKLVNNKLVYKGLEVEKKTIEEDYQKAKFDNQGFNRFYADDYIEGPLDYTVYAKITDIDVKRVTGSGKNRTTIDLFKGIFASTVGNKDIGTSIKISKNKLKILKNENRVEMDSQEFEKYFDIYAENKILAMRILTSDIMESLIEFRNKYNSNFEIVFRDSTIYFRFFTGAMFEPRVFGSSMDKELLLTYFYIFKFIIEITKKINNVLQEIEL